MFVYKYQLGLLVRFVYIPSKNVHALQRDEKMVEIKYGYVIF
jgi:hypothetical protein